MDYVLWMGHDIARTIPGLTNIENSRGGGNNDDEDVMTAIRIGIASRIRQRQSNLFSL
jgi:hypothetical protein